MNIETGEMAGNSEPIVYGHQSIQSNDDLISVTFSGRVIMNRYAYLGDGAGGENNQIIRIVAIAFDDFEEIT